MSYVFLIFLSLSGGTTKEVIPMQDMSQCRAAIQAIHQYDEKIHSASSHLDCIEIK